MLEMKQIANHHILGVGFAHVPGDTLLKRKGLIASDSKGTLILHHQLLSPITKDYTLENLHCPTGTLLVVAPSLVWRCGQAAGFAFDFSFPCYNKLTLSSIGNNNEGSNPSPGYSGGL